MILEVPPKSKLLPVVETFGPTLQGEGTNQGETSHFVRFGACDFRCVWCDTPHAVLPGEIAMNKEMLAAEAIVNRLSQHGAARWIVLTGGNPAMHELGHLVTLLHSAGYKVSAETQGSMYKPWLTMVDSLCLSPKPPSSKQVFDLPTLEKVVDQRTEFYNDGRDTFFKVVVFNEKDFLFARQLHLTFPRVKMYLSAGNDAGRTVGNPDRVDPRNLDAVRRDLLRQSEWLVNAVLGDIDFQDVVVQTQYHVLLWGNKQGV